MDYLFSNPVSSNIARLVGRNMEEESEDSYNYSADSDISTVVEGESQNRRKKKGLTKKFLDRILPGEGDSRDTTPLDDGGGDDNFPLGGKKPPPDDLRALIERIEILERANDRQREKVPIKSPNFNVPAKYSSLNSSDLRVIDSQYPKAKFYDGSKGTEIYDFLYLLREAHKNCPVSENEFKRLLLQRLGGAALDLVSGLIEDQEPVSVIYTELYSTFTTTVDSYEARQIMKGYKSPRSFGIKRILGELGRLGNIVGRGCYDRAQQKFYVSTHSQDALESCLPEKAFEIAHAAIARDRFIKGREPTLQEIRKCLAPHVEQIDRIIKNDKTHKFAPPRKIFSIVYSKTHHGDNPNKKNRDVNNLEVNNVEVEVNKVELSQSKQQPQNKGKGNAKVKPKNGKSFNNNKKKTNQNKQTDKQTTETNRQKERPYCNFCGQFGHDSFKGCYAILDDNLKQYQGAGAREACRICIRKISLNLKHPEDLCPGRDFMIKKYLDGTIKPRGPFVNLPELRGQNLANAQ